MEDKRPSEGDPRPVFTQLYDSICQRLRGEKLERVMEEFQGLSDDLQRVNHVLEFPELVDFNVSPKYLCKNEDEAESLDASYGNIIQNEALAFNAIQLISESLRKTPADQERALALRLQKKAWAQLLLDDFETAFSDASKALEFSVEPEALWNAHEMLGYCYAKKGNNKAADAMFSKALKELSRSTESNEMKAKATSRIMVIYKSVKVNLGKQYKKEKEEGSKASSFLLPKVSHGAHSILEAASAAVDVFVVRGKGRCVFANRDLLPGDVIMVDSAYVSKMESASYQTHCFHCFRRCPSFLPCVSCAAVQYCSSECRQASWNSVHQFECCVLGHFEDHSLGKLGLLVFRIMAKTKWDKLKGAQKKLMSLMKLESQEKAELQPETHRKAWRWDGRYSPKDYQTVFNLAGNTSKRTFGDMLKRTISAIFLANCLKTGRFFGRDMVVHADLAFVAALLLRHMQSSSCNAYEISESRDKSPSMQTSTFQEVGGAIYPTVSLTCHSCFPNVSRYSIGTHCVLRATRTIPKGDEVLDTYGFYYQADHREERRTVLERQYKFLCECEACKGEWPLYSPQEGSCICLKCPVKSCSQPIPFPDRMKSKCLACGNSDHSSKLAKEFARQMGLYEKAVDAIKKGEIERGLQVLLGHQVFLDKHAVNPAKHVTHVQELIRHCFSLQGNLFRDQ